MSEIPLPKRSSLQRQLFPVNRPIRSMGESRWAVGEIIEDLTAAATGAIRLRTDSRVVMCPDLRYSPSLFFETKAVGKSGSAIIYRCRMEKDLRFMAEGHRLVYWFWRHAYPVTQATHFEELRQGVLSTLRYILIVDAALLHAEVTKKPVRVVNSAYADPQIDRSLGYTRNGYGIGWTVPLSRLVEMASRVYVHYPIETFVSSPEYSLFFRGRPVQKKLALGGEL